MGLRIVTGVVLIAAVVALVLWAPAWAVAIGAAAVALLAMIEFFALGERLGLRPFREWTLICAAALYYAQYTMGLVETRAFGGVVLSRSFGATISIDVVLIAFLFGCAVIILATRRPLQDVLPAISISSAGLLFIGLPFSYLVRIN